MAYRSMLRKRIDSNHTPIVAALRATGALVQSLATIGGGCADLLVLHRGKLSLLEIKTLKGKVRADQAKRMAEGWPVQVVRSVDEAIAAVS